jgi:sterol desaturase/sphingolipid hydroxylase (fatty acid hydroxylase superfamily)
MLAASWKTILDVFERTVYSSLNYRLGLLTDVAAAAAFLVLGLYRFSGPPLLAAAAFVAGLQAWGLLEYSLHRWVLHGRVSRASTGHAEHHADSRALISTPLLLIAALGLALWGLLGLVLPSGIAALLVAGVYSGYNGFALLHHVHHHGALGVERLAYFRRRERLHEIHHHRRDVNYGTTTTFWDRLLGTFEAAE